MTTVRPSKRQGTPKFGPSLQTAGQTSKAGNIPTNNPVRRLTQADQDKADEEKHREAIENLVQTWLSRLQLISVITTFFAGIESGMLGKALPTTATQLVSPTGQMANICFMCALVVHAYAAGVSFLGAFFLVGYKLSVAQSDEDEAEHELVDSPTSFYSNDPEKTGNPTSYPGGLHNTAPTRGRVKIQSEFSGGQIIWSTNPRLIQVGPFQGQPPTELLARCFSLSVFLAFFGFSLAIVGLISFAWNGLPLSISIAASVTMLFCLIAGALILVFPSTKTSHIYYNTKTH